MVFGEGRADPCYREMLEEMSGPDVEGWNEDSYVEAKKCFLVEGIYETTCMCVWTLVGVNSKPQMCSGMPNKMSFRFKKIAQTR